MPTGACGINCDVCRLNLMGLCTTCGHGKSDEARIKLETQKRVLGDTCPILTCVTMNHKSYCLRDCSQFPCDNYAINPYPFSTSFLDMQARRRKQIISQTDPLGHPVEIPDEYWEALRKRDLNLVCAFTLAELNETGQLIFDFLNQTIALDLTLQESRVRTKEGFIPLDNPLLTLTALVYFKKVDRLFPMGKDLIGTRDMKLGRYFQGENRLGKAPILRRFKDDPDEFLQAAKALGGGAVDMADTACVLYPFARVPVYYLLWDLDGDPHMSILFDRSVESLLEPPMIWSLVNLINSYLFSV